MVKMPNRCVAFGCSNTSSTEGVSVFHFPKDECIKRKWIAQVRRTRDKWTGHCAKFGAYSVMELKHKMVLDIQLVQVECNTSDCISINVATTVFIIIIMFRVMK